jgi:hypothetical protein
MTAEKWDACADPRQMLQLLFTDGRCVPAARKVRLFNVACCRRVIDRLPSEVCRRAVDAAEQFAQTPPTREAARLQRDQLLHHPVAGIASQAVANAILCAVSFEPLSQMVSTRDWNVYRTDDVINAHWWCAEAVYQESVYIEPPDPRRWAMEKGAEDQVQSELLRCIFGNPFRPVVLDPAWRTSDVVALAKGIYDDRAFDRMPILADALQDAGCTNDDVLNHCRNDGVLARGCWVVDLVLGKM